MFLNNSLPGQSGHVVGHDAIHDNVNSKAPRYNRKGPFKGAGHYWHLPKIRRKVSENLCNEFMKFSSQVEKYQVGVAYDEGGVNAYQVFAYNDTVISM